MKFNDLVEWNEAIGNGGFYFERALYLGLPKPPVCFVYDRLSQDSEAISLIVDYHKLFVDAEIDKVEIQGDI